MLVLTGKELRQEKIRSLSSLRRSKTRAENKAKKEKIVARRRNLGLTDYPFSMHGCLARDTEGFPIPRAAKAQADVDSLSERSNLDLDYLESLSPSELQAHWENWQATYDELTGALAVSDVLGQTETFIKARKALAKHRASLASDPKTGKPLTGIVESWTTAKRELVADDAPDEIVMDDTESFTYMDSPARHVARLHARYHWEVNPDEDCRLPLRDFDFGEGHSHGYEPPAMYARIVVRKLRDGTTVFIPQYCEPKRGFLLRQYCKGKVTENGFSSRPRGSKWIGGNRIVWVSSRTRKIRPHSLPAIGTPSPYLPAVRVDREKETAERIAARLDLANYVGIVNHPAYNPALLA